MTKVFHVPVAHPWQLLIGLSIWALWFVLVYGAISVACSAAPPPPERAMTSWINGALVVITLGVTAALGAAAFACAKGARRIRSSAGADDRSDGLPGFIATAAAALYAVAALSTLFAGLPLLFVSPCV